MRLTDDQLLRFLAYIAETEPEELDCDQVLDLLPGHAGQDGGAVEPSEVTRQRVAQHLRVCPECREELEALMGAVPE